MHICYKPFEFAIIIYMDVIYEVNKLSTYPELNDNRYRVAQSIAEQQLKRT